MSDDGDAQDRELKRQGDGARERVARAKQRELAAHQRAIEQRELEDEPPARPAAGR